MPFCFEIYSDLIKFYCVLLPFTLDEDDEFTLICIPLLVFLFFFITRVIYWVGFCTIDDVEVLVEAKGIVIKIFEVFMNTTVSRSIID